MFPSVLSIAENSGQWSDWLAVSGSVALAIVLVVACLAAWLTNLIALPGNWICVLLLFKLDLFYRCSFRTMKFNQFIYYT